MGYQAHSDVVHHPPVTSKCQSAIVAEPESDSPSPSTRQIPVPPSDEFSVPSVASSSYPERGGNSVNPLVDGEVAFREICRAVEAAEASVWVTVTFLWEAFRMPDARGTFFDVLDSAAARGLDVRVVFWRPDAVTAGLKTNAFWGSPEQLAFLDARRPSIKIRWDRARHGCCQHQKSWLVDAGSAGEVAFVGGINQNPHSVVMPEHRGRQQNHDIYAELRGPSVADVHHNFVQRWNDASESDQSLGHWGRGAERDIDFPTAVGRPSGTSIVQVQRTLAEGRHPAIPPAGGNLAVDTFSGERSILDQYLQAIDAATSTIYLENQYLEDPSVVDSLHKALDRGVEVAIVLPGEPVLPGRSQDDVTRSEFHRSRASLSDYPQFIAVGLAGLDDDDQRQHVYVHAKVMLIDDEWGTIGSANLHWFSLYGNAEMNVSFWDAKKARELRCQLLHEHLGIEVHELTDSSSLRLLADVAKSNAGIWRRGSSAWQGNAFALDLVNYGR